MVAIGKWLLYGIIGAFAISALVNPKQALASTQAFGGVGTSLASLGGGIQSLLTGTGTGIAKLFNPLFTLRDLIYGPQAGVQIGTDIRQTSSTQNLALSQYAQQQQAIQLDPASPFTPITAGFGGIPAYGSPPQYSEQAAQAGAAAAANTAIQGFSYSFQPSISPVPVTQATVHGQTVPLSAEAIQYYQEIGVTVSPVSDETVAAQNESNGGGVSSASSNYSAGAAQAAGYSTGSPTVSE
ncbi:MAG TPA: hypothetical protein EYN66_07565 [Myxococcales bacterium]|nr:hypothetical protein [Myxococcales bacterium]